MLTSCIPVWYRNCSAADRKTLQRTVNTAAKIIGAPLPSILDIFLTRCSSKANSIVKNPTHSSHSLFQLLPSGRRYYLLCKFYVFFVYFSCLYLSIFIIFYSIMPEFLLHCILLENLMRYPNGALTLLIYYE